MYKQLLASREYPFNFTSKGDFSNQKMSWISVLNGVKMNSYHSQNSLRIQKSAYGKIFYTKNFLAAENYEDPSFITVLLIYDVENKQLLINKKFEKYYPAIYKKFKEYIKYIYDSEDDIVYCDNPGKNFFLTYQKPKFQSIIENKEAGERLLENTLNLITNEINK